MSLTDMNAQKSKNLRIMQLSAVGILLNVLPSLLVSKLGLPLYLDSIGTILSAAAGGIVPGTIAAFLTNLIKGFWDLSSVYYIPINILLALLTAFLAPRKMLTRFPGMLLAVICFALAGGVIGGVLTWYLNGSVFGGSVLSSRLLEYFSGGGHPAAAHAAAAFCGQLLIRQSVIDFGTGQGSKALAAYEGHASDCRSHAFCRYRGHGNHVVAVSQFHY